MFCPLSLDKEENRGYNWKQEGIFSFSLYPLSVCLSGPRFVWSLLFLSTSKAPSQFCYQTSTHAHMEAQVAKFPVFTAKHETILKQKVGDVKEEERQGEVFFFFSLFFEAVPHVLLSGGRGDEACIVFTCQLALLVGPIRCEWQR